MKNLKENKFFKMTSIVAMMFGFTLLTSCGSSSDAVANRGVTTTTLFGFVPGGSGVTTSVTELEDQFFDKDLEVEREYDSAWGFRDNELSQEDGLWHDFEESSDKINVTLSDIDGDRRGSDSLTKEEIVDSIFDNETEIGRSLSIEITPIPICLISQQNVERKLGYEVVHRLANGRTVVHIISPDLPLYLNPLITVQTDSVELLRVFETQRTEYVKALTWIGNYGVNYYCQ